MVCSRSIASRCRAHGEGDTEEEALEDLREALIGLIEEFGVPRELSVTVAA
ncbi:MAG: hypothetical protein ABW022_22215 [Actinoplanes sp.]